MVLREIVLVGSFFDLLIKGCSFLQVPLLNAVHHFDPFFYTLLCHIYHQGRVIICFSWNQIVNIIKAMQLHKQ